MTSRVGLLRHWGQLESRASAESGTKNATITYTTITKIRCYVNNVAGGQFVNGRGADQSRTPVYEIEFRRVPDLSKGNYIKLLNGPFAGIRFKLDDQLVSRLGRRITIAAYPIGETTAFSAPTTPTLPDII